MKPQKKSAPTFADLYPEIAEDDRQEAEYYFKRYINLVWRIYKRARRDDPENLTKILKEARFKRQNGNR